MTKYIKKKRWPNINTSIKIILIVFVVIIAIMIGASNIAENFIQESNNNENVDKGVPYNYLKESITEEDHDLILKQAVIGMNSYKEYKEYYNDAQMHFDAYNESQFEEIFLSDPKIEEFFESICIKEEFYPRRIWYSWDKETEILSIVDYDNGKIICDYVPIEKVQPSQENNIDFSFPQTTEDSNYIVTLKSASKTDYDYFSVSYKIKDKNTGEEFSISSFEMFGLCDYFQFYLVDVDSQTRKKLTGISKCGRSIDLLDEDNIFWKDFTGPVKLIATNNYLTSNPNFLEDIDKGGVEGLFVFNINLG